MAKKSKKEGGPSGAAATASFEEPQLTIYNFIPNIEKVNITNAEILFAQIGEGKGRAVHVSNRDTNDKVSRSFRAKVSAANQSGDCVINTGDGAGYYRPRKGNVLEEAELDHYLRSEIHRAKEILNKVDAMREAHYGRH